MFWPFMITSTVLILPSSLYLAVLPRFFIWALIFPLLYAYAVIALKKQKTLLSILFSIPAYLLISWLGYILLHPYIKLKKKPFILIKRSFL